ncbi:hypothetical protein LSH36_583g02045 [Paralvinella palmiformis]|uniref:imidazoleglycerol-phosphate dehydratase n=1 Tax=Paralvinella palmiformis TaxID=53620 RepID=A0AAD9MV10_9ANNE|nr:hypothetical protein LSH36_583g02045 [Paralvinella palmiformis]
MLTPEEIRSTYRLLDREGELLLIRSDITLFLARQIGIQIPHVTLPLRLSYSGEILRHSSGGDFVNSDIHQSGIELIGAPALEGDIEILLLLFEALDALGGKNVAEGDIEVDPHHLVEDIGIVLGICIKKWWQAHTVSRFGHAVIPMDDALSEVVLDISGRSYLLFRDIFPQPMADGLLRMGRHYEAKGDFFEAFRLYWQAGDRQKVEYMAKKMAQGIRYVLRNDAYAKLGRKSHIGVDQGKEIT